VKGVALNLTRSSEKRKLREWADPFNIGAGHVAQTIIDETDATTPESKTASSRTTTSK